MSIFTAAFEKNQSSVTPETMRVIAFRISPTAYPRNDDPVLVEPEPRFANRPNAEMEIRHDAPKWTMRQVIERRKLREQIFKIRLSDRAIREAAEAAAEAERKSRSWISKAIASNNKRRGLHPLTVTFMGSREVQDARYAFGRKLP